MALFTCKKKITHTGTPNCNFLSDALCNSFNVHSNSKEMKKKNLKKIIHATSP